MSKITFIGAAASNKGSLFESVRQLLRSQFASAKRVAVIAPVGQHLIDVWDACIYEGREPLMLQFPTVKLSRVYWSAEVVDAIQSVGIDLLVCTSPDCDPGARCATLYLDDLTPEDDVDAARPLPKNATFLQMSSGTTGHRKGMQFDLTEVRNHVDRYNEVLLLSASDTVVSWLPLYHDMGFVACFLLPRILGIDLVLMDPVEWVRRPEMLFEAIEQFNGTVCYMPNFGFEVMSSLGRVLPGMRLWISCSEPTRPATMKKFATVMQLSDDKLVNCWGMAENIFAVTHSHGISTREFDGETIVSAGRPIPGTEVKSVDGELFVKSDYSIKDYIGAEVQLDAEGYYASGDLGIVLDGEVYLQGRKRDILINGGRKRFLSDIDHLVGLEIPEAAGRISSFGLPDPALGTDTPIILIEDPRFWEKNRDADLIRRAAARTGLESAQVHFVPPKFVTKTSSGKLNRRATAQNWALRAKSQETLTSSREAARHNIQTMFPWLNHSLELTKQIDSLGLVNLSLILSNCGYDQPLGPEDTLDDILSRIDTGDDQRIEVIRILSMGDANVLHRFTGPVFEAIKKIADVPVQLRHVCVPPSPILMSDFIFNDYFKAQLPEAEAAGFSRVINEIRNASVLIVDDAVNLTWPKQAMVYPMLAHDFQGDAEANRLALRWAAYSEDHNLMPVKLVPGNTISPEAVNVALDQLSSYLNIPIVRVAYGTDTAEYTVGWDVHGAGNTTLASVADDTSGIDDVKLSADLTTAMLTAIEKAPKRMGLGDSFSTYNDQPHWCSWIIHESFADFIIEHFQNIVVLGKPASVSYFMDEAKKRGRHVTYRSDLTVPEDCDCVVQAGSWGRPETEKPIFQLMTAGWQPEPFDNVLADLAAQCPPSARDWHWPNKN